MPSKTTQIKQASLFDLDGTLLKVNSSFYFGKYLYQLGFFSFFRLLVLSTIYLSHKMGFISIAALHHAIFKRLFYGRNALQVEAHARRFVEIHLDSMLYLPAIKRLQKAQLEGHFVAILSSSPDFIVKNIARKLKVLYVESSIYAIGADGNFSHIEHLVEGDAKAVWISKASKDHAIARQNLTAYSDSTLDLPFLYSCGKKVVVNPSKKLRSIGLQNQWEII